VERKRLIKEDYKFIKEERKFKWGKERDIYT
jgi:hypothetical protein